MVASLVAGLTPPIFSLGSGVAYAGVKSIPADTSILSFPLSHFIRV